MERNSRPRAADNPADALNALLLELGLAENGRTYVPTGKVSMDAEAILRRQKHAYGVPDDPKVRDRLWRSLARKARAGDEVARARLVLHNLGLVFGPVNRRWDVITANRPSTPETFRNDLVQEAFLALLRAAEKYPPDAGTTFAHYAWTAIANALRDLERFSAEARRHFAEIDAARTSHREGATFDVVSDEGVAVRNPAEAEDDYLDGDPADSRPSLRVVKLSDSAGGVRDPKTLVSSLDEVRVVMSRGKTRPTLTCGYCGETFRTRSEEEALRWYREHRGCAWVSDDVEYGHHWLWRERETAESATRKLRRLERERTEDAYFRYLKDAGYAIRKRLGL